MYCGLMCADGMGLVQTDNEVRLTRATANLQQVEISDVPGTVRRTARDAIVMLKDAKVSVSLRAANAISMLDEVTQNPCLSSFTRVRLWSVLSELESIRE